MADRADTAVAVAEREGGTVTGRFRPLSPNDRPEHVIVTEFALRY